MLRNSSQENKMSHFAQTLARRISWQNLDQIALHDATLRSRFLILRRNSATREGYTRLYFYDSKVPYLNFPAAWTIVRAWQQLFKTLATSIVSSHFLDTLALYKFSRIVSGMCPDFISLRYEHSHYIFLADR
jgi:hypothetical protein